MEVTKKHEIVKQKSEHVFPSEKRIRVPTRLWLGFEITLKKIMVNWLPIKIIVATALMSKFHLLYKP